MTERGRLSASADGTVYRDGQPVPVSVHSNGYLKCRAGNETFKAHRIVAEELLGPAVDDRRFPRLMAILSKQRIKRWGVAHKNGDKQDNRIENLMWAPGRFNQYHEVPCPLVDPHRGARPLINREAKMAGLKQLPQWNRPRLCGRSKCPLIGACDRRHLRRGELRPQHANAMRLRFGKLTIDDVAEIRSACSSGLISFRAMAKSKGVSDHTVRRIVRGTKWRNVC